MTPQIEMALTGIRRIADVWQSAKPDSLIDYTRQLRVEPITLIDQDCLYDDNLSEVLQSLLSLFSGYYLQAVSVSTQVGAVHVGRYLDRLNPNRDATGHALDRAHTATGNVLRLENFADRLPVIEDESVALEELALEARGKNPSAATMRDVEAQYRLARRRLSARAADDRRVDGQHRDMQMGRGTVDRLQEQSNLSIGKMLDVTITDGEHNVVVPIAVRLMAHAIASASLVHILSHGTQDTSVVERFHAWRAGRLGFIKDLILCNDLVDAKRKNLMRDKDGLYSTMTARQTQGFWSGVISGDPSIGMSSNLVVMSQATAEQLEVKTNYQLKNFSQRSKIFEETAVMILAVIDKEWQRITFYHRGIAMPTQLGIRDLKAANKGSGPDVSDILRAYQLGNSIPM